MDTIANNTNPEEKAIRQSPRGPTRFPGIVKAARDLGVSRTALYFMLSGRRTDLRSLRRRYDAWAAAQEAANKEA